MKKQKNFNGFISIHFDIEDKIENDIYMSLVSKQSARRNIEIINIIKKYYSDDNEYKKLKIDYDKLLNIVTNLSSGLSSGIIKHEIITQQQSIPIKNDIISSTQIQPEIQKEDIKLSPIIIDKKMDDNELKEKAKKIDLSFIDGYNEKDNINKENSKDYDGMLEKFYKNAFVLNESE